MSTYAWIITEDHIASDGEPEGTNGNAVGVAGPHDAAQEQIDRAKEEGRKFRMLDDDAILYYEGRIWAETEGSEDDFGPLWDFGEPNAGAVVIQYRLDGKWVTL
jgi:hypothetical protein